MGQPKKMRNLVGILKDKVSLIKATLLLTSKPTTSLHVAVIRATTHHPLDPPSENTVDYVLTLGHHHRQTAFALIDALLRRLQGTHSAYVALKCLLTLHHVITRGSPVLRDQISSAVNGPHDNLLKVSTFRDESDADTWEISSWVRWYAGVLEQSLISSYTLGSFLSPLTSQDQNNRRERISYSYNNSIIKVLRELSSLVTMVEQISRAPESLHYQRISLIYEVMKLVGEDYRITMRQISPRITQIGETINDLSDDELRELSLNLKTLEDCKEKLFLMFLNKKKSDGAWDLIGEMREKVERVKERRESLKMVTFQGTELTRLDRMKSDESKALAIVSTQSQGPTRKRWLNVEWNTLVVPVQ